MKARMSGAVLALLALLASYMVPPSKALADARAPGLCFAGCGGVSVAPLNGTWEAQVVELVNQRRANAGLLPLKLVDSLATAARYHAADMAADDYFEHDTYDRQGGQLALVCDTWTRIGSLYDGFACAENIGAGYGSPQDVVQGWMDSDGHRRNILSTTAREVGAGYYEGGSWGRYWVLNLGVDHDRYPLIINGEARQTQSTAVTLTIYGDWDELRLRNDGGPWSAWLPFANTMAWTLASQSGTRAVSAEMRTTTQTTGASDSIDLLGVTPAHHIFLPMALRGAR